MDTDLSTLDETTRVDDSEDDVTDNAPEPSTSTSDFVEEECIYIGRRFTNDNKVFDAWIHPHHCEGDYILWPTNVQAPVGSVYALTTSDNHTRIFTKGPHSPRFIRMNLSDPRRVEWAAIDRVARAQKEQEATARRLRKEGDPLTYAIATIRDAYNKLPLSTQRAAFIAVLLEEVTRYRPRKVGDR